MTPDSPRVTTNPSAAPSDPTAGATIDPVTAPADAAPSAAEVWAALRKGTQARIGLGRSGDSLPTASLLDFQLAHARARDAVHAPFDADRVAAQLSGIEKIRVRSAAPDRATYLQRPDLGRRLAAECRGMLHTGDYDAAFVIADGLSARAVHEHAAAVLQETLPRLPGWRVAPVVLASQARVALGDEIGELLGARMVAILIGERPGLTAADSLGVYLTFDPKSGRKDAERNCISNIRPPAGLDYRTAAQTLGFLMTEARRRRLTGVGLKENAAALPG